MSARERPILFSAPMVRAILEGRKTQTRRVVKPQPCNLGDVIPFARCPYGVPGDRLWVRETTRADIVRPHTWQHTYVADGAGVDLSPSFDPGNGYRMLRATRSRPVTPSIHMPRWASRIDLEVTGVRVERLQDISEDDARAEGVEVWQSESPDRVGAPVLRAFRVMWDGGDSSDYVSRQQRGLLSSPGSWDANPWVWVVEFRRIKP